MNVVDILRFKNEMQYMQDWLLTMMQCTTYKKQLLDMSSNASFSLK